MSEEPMNTNQENGDSETSEESKPKKPRQQRQKRFGVLIDLEDKAILEKENMKVVLKGESSAVVVFENNAAMTNFINDECKKPSGVEISKGVFRLEEGGFFKPIVGRDVQKKTSFN